MSRRPPQPTRIALLVFAALALGAGLVQAQDFIATGSYNGNAVDNRSITGLGFQPDVVLIQSLADHSTYARTATMAPGLAKDLGRNEIISTNQIESLDVDGFTVGSAPEVNGGGETYHWVALRTLDGVFDLGSYMGDGTNDQNIGGLAGRPIALLVLAETAELAVLRTGDMASYQSLTLSGTSPLTDAISGFLSDGFAVGPNPAVNEMGAIYHYIAWYDTPGSTAQGTYLGDDIDDRAIGGLGFAPEWVLVRSGDNQDGVHRGRSLTGDFSHIFRDQIGGTDLIQDLTADGFRVGVRGEVNSTGMPYHWLALANPLPTADIEVGLAVDKINADVGDTLTFTVTARNGGALPIDAFVINSLLPPGLLPLSDSPQQGTYDGVTGEWSAGPLAPEDPVSLTVVASVEAGLADQTFQHVAELSSSTPADTDPMNDLATVEIRVRAADVGLTVLASSSLVDVGDLVTFTVVATGYEPDDALGTVIRIQQAPELEFVSATNPDGTFDAATGIWELGDLAVGTSAVLTVTSRTAVGSGGRSLVTDATVISVAREDINPANDTAGAVVEVIGQAPTPELLVIPDSATPETVWPDASRRPVLVFTVVNRGDAPDTVTALTVSNLTTGSDAPDQATLDAEWYPLVVATWVRGKAGSTFDTSTPQTAFSDGRAVITGVRWAVQPGDTLTVSIAAAPSLQARDGAVLVAGLAEPADLVARQKIVFASGTPLVSGHSLVIDGFIARQATLHEVPQTLLGVGSQRNLIFDIELPSNGYRADSIYGFNLINRGSALAGSDIARMEAWSDDGDGLFSAAGDHLLGELVDSGDRWQMTGLAAPVPVGGHRFFFTVDIAETAQPASDIRMGLPIEYGPGVEMVSGNDGPMDVVLENTRSHGISASDRVILTRDWVHPGEAYPDADGLPLLSLVLTNTYTGDQTLQGLSVNNGTMPAGDATQAQIDAIAQQVVLRLDGDNDGVLGDLVDDPPLGNGAFVGGVVTFPDLDLTLPPFTSVRIFVAADLDPAATAEGDRIGAFVAEASDVIVPGGAVVAAWPLDSGAPWTVNGMVAAQIELNPVPLQSLGPDEGPALVLDLRVPGNGYRSDELVGIAVADSGTAGPDDFARVQLWVDGGNGTFDAGLLDDTATADLIWTGNVWSSPLLNMPVDPTGRQLFVTVDAAAAPTDSATVRFMVPRDGIRMASANSGPLDMPIVDPGTLVLTTSPLRSTLAFLRNASTVGQTGQVRMSVRNTGVETLTGVAPGPLVPTGAGALDLGPATPATFDLAPASEAFFVWDFTATAAGSVILTGNAQGTGNMSLDFFGSAPSPTSLHSVLTTPVQADLYAVVNLPVSVNKGQTGLMPMTLTLVNPGSDTVADIELTDLRLRLAETAGGTMIVPEDLVEHITVSEGTNVYAALDVLPTSATDIDLHFDPPARITSSEPVTLGVRIDLKLSTDVPSFVLSVESADWFAARDTVTGAPVPMVMAEGDFPIRTSQANLVSPAGSLVVALPGDTAGMGVPGQADVPLTGFQVTNETSEATSSPIHVTRVAFVLRDETGTALTTPLDRFTGMTLSTVYQELFNGLPEVVADSVLVINLAAPAIIAADATVTLDLTVDIAPDASPSTLVPGLADVSMFSGLDGNNGLPVPVNAGTPATGAPLFIVGEPGDISASGTGLLPSTVDDGARQVAILDLDLVHGGDPDAASAQATSLTLTILDEARHPLDPSRVLERLRVVFAGNIVGDIASPTASDGRVLIPLVGTTLVPAGISSFTVDVDLVPGATGGFECLLAAGDIALTNAVTGDPVAVLPTGPWPLTSGMARIVVPAEELAVGGEGRMPPLLAPRGEPYTVLTMTVRNPATTGMGGIALHSLTLTQPEEGLDLGLVVGEIVLLLDGGIAASATDLDKAARSATLLLDTPLVIPADEQLSLEIAVTVVENAPAGVLLVQMAEDGFLAGPEGAAPGGIRIVPETGQSLPVVSEKGNVGKSGLEASYANFPNPFAAGREPTTFAFSLPEPGRVTLRILTPHGKLVATLLQGEPRGANFYQQDQWSGLNGNGHAVRNGVYIAELVVDFDDGTRQRVLRKVAVAR